MHHHVENIIVSCLEGKRTELIEHVLNDCDIVGKILVAERLSSLSTESNAVRAYLDESWSSCLSQATYPGHRFPQPGAG